LKYRSKRDRRTNKASAGSAAAITVGGFRGYFDSLIVFGPATNIILCEQLKATKHTHIWCGFMRKMTTSFVSWGRHMPINSDFYLSKQQLLSCTNGINVCALEQLESSFHESGASGLTEQQDQESGANSEGLPDKGKELILQI
jgi:hypothetical protein